MNYKGYIIHIAMPFARVYTLNGTFIKRFHSLDAAMKWIDQNGGQNA